MHEQQIAGAVLAASNAAHFKAALRLQMAAQLAAAVLTGLDRSPGGNKVDEPEELAECVAELAVLTADAIIARVDGKPSPKLSR